MALEKEKIDRISLYVLVGVGVVALFGGILQFRSHLFVHERTIFAEFNEFLLAQEQSALAETVAGTDEAETIEELQLKDTDGDGLNDFQELYVVNTSPYLTDSDSDGTTDTEEHLAGTDPNCPEGAACSQERTGGSGIVTAAETEFSSIAGGEDLIPTTEDGEVDTNALRDMLRQSGVPEDVLSQTDDATLIAMAQQVASSTQAGANAFANLEAEAESIKNLSQEEKRDLLRQGGLDQASIDSLTDEQVNELINGAVDQAVTEAIQQETTTDTEAAAVDAALEQENQEE